MVYEVKIFSNETADVPSSGVFQKIIFKAILHFKTRITIWLKPTPRDSSNALVGVPPGLCAMLHQQL
jgi:hypothetical protein